VGLGACVSLATSGLAQSPTNPARDHWNHIVALNTLTAEGSGPFYLKIEFQVFDLKGKPAETGTAEVWWAPHRRYEVIASPSWNWTPAPGVPHQPATRQSYLIDAFIEQIMHPTQGAKISPSAKIVEADKKFGSNTLRCLSADPAIPAPAPTSYCVDAVSDELRVSFNDGAVVLRNNMGKFRDTVVARDLVTSYGKNKAIAGKVVALTSLPADDDHIKPSPEPAAPATTETVSHGGVVAGRKIGGQPPLYPYMARQNNITGTVVIAATISKEGILTSPIVIGSPDASLSDAALSAVRTWKYQPYLLNGQPTDVDTTIEVNFNL